MTDTISRRQININSKVKNNNINKSKKNPKKFEKISSVAKNGLSVELLRRLGHKISVHHYRAYISDDLANEGHDNIIYLPISTKYLNDEHVQLQVKGGYTRIAITPCTTVNSVHMKYGEVITDLENIEHTTYYGETQYYTSRCANEDVYCYKLGVTKALDRIYTPLAKMLLNGPFN